MLDTLFKFPIVMIDGTKEDRKERQNQLLAIDDDAEVDIIIGEAEVPYQDFLSVTDRWLPTESSFQNALDGKFDACSAVFMHSGSFVIPWNKEKFKKELTKFSKKFVAPPAKDPGFTVLNMTKEQFFNELKNSTTEDGEDDE